VTYTAQVNTGAERSGKIFVQGAEFIVTQLAAPCQIIDGTNPSNLVYLANTACERIIQYPGPLPALFTQASSSYEGLEWGPDGWLYAFDPTRGLIHRFDPSDPSFVGIVHEPTVGLPTQPRDGVFNHLGDLIVVDGTTGNLWVFTNKNAVGMTPSFDARNPIPNPGIGAVADVATAANGDLLVTDSGSKSVLRIPFNPAARSYDSLSATEAVDAGSFDAPGAIVRSGNGTIFVGDFDSNNGYLRAFEPGGTAFSVPCGTFTGAAIQDVDIASDDTLYVTSVNLNTSVGTLTEIQFSYDEDDGWTCGDTPLTIATFTGNDSGNVPLSGVAVPFTGRDGKFVVDVPVDFPFPTGSQLFNFWDFLFGFQDPAASCEVTVSAKEYATTDIQRVINTQLDPVTAGPVTLYGDGGAVQVIDYEPFGVCDPREYPEPDFVLSMMGVYEANNIGVVVCHDDESTSPCVLDDHDLAVGDCDCEVIPLESFYLGGPLPDDPRTSGRTPRTSQAFLVDVESAGGGDAEFCGFKEPLNLFANPDDEDLPEFEGGSTVSVQYKLADLTKNGNCDKGPYVTRDVAARLTFAQIHPDTLLPINEIYPIDAVGGATIILGDTYFSNPANKNKPWKIDLKLSQDGVSLPPGGLYQITVFADVVAPPDLGITEPLKVFPIQTNFFYVK